MYREWKQKSLIGPLNIYGILALAGVIGPVILIFADLISALSDPNYNPIRDSISSLALTPNGWVQTIGFMAIGLLTEVFVVGLFLSVARKRGFKVGIVLLVCFGFGLLMAGAFREDPVGSSHTIQGNIHTITTAIVFGIFPVAALLIAYSLKGDPYWKGSYFHTLATSIFAIAFMLGHIRLTSEMSWFGLYERIAILNPILWLEVMAVKLLRLSLTED